MIKKFIIASIIFLTTFCAAEPKNIVILLHGILKDRTTMQKLERHLNKAGFITLNISYPSVEFSIKQLADDIYHNDEVFSKINNSDYKINFVTHSMGGLLVAEIISNYKIDNLSRIVMIAPPIQGSEISDFCVKYANGIYKRLYGIAGQELVTGRPDRINLTTTNNEFELGIIAGDRSSSILGYLVLPRPHDGRVTVKNSQHPLQKQHVVIHATHTKIIYKPETMRLTENFLVSGSFF